MSDKIAVLAFAKLVGVDEALIRRYIKQGKFSEAAIEYDEAGRKKIVVDIALAEWKAFGGGSDKYRRLQPKSDRPDPEAHTPALASPKSGDVEEFPQKEASSRRLEFYKAETAALEYKKLSGELVPKAQVEKQLFAAGAELRSALMSIPDQQIDAIMGAKDRAKAHAILSEAIETELRRFADSNALDKKEEPE